MDQLHAKLKTFFDSGQTLPIAYRKRQLKNLLRFLSDHEATICKALHDDLSKPRFESLTSEIGVLRVEINHTLSNLHRWARKRRVWTPLAQFPASSSYTFEPKGVVLIIGPWNFPVQLTLGPLIGAIAAGNTVVIKPSEFAPHVSQMLATYLKDYLDPESVCVVEGDLQVSQQLLQVKFEHIFFTGSTSVGRIVMQEAAKNLIPVTLELGGKSPCVVDESANLELAAKRISWGKLINCGQVCLSPDYVLVHASVSKALLGALTTSVTQKYGPDPKTSPDYGRIISQKHTKRLQSLLKGQNIVAGGEVDVDQKYVAPTLVLNPDLASPLMQEEIFGPILPVIEYRDFSEALSIIKRLEKPLAIYVFSSSNALIDELRSQTASGGLCVNDTVSHVTIPDLPFGGIGASGIGTYHGEDSFQAFSYKRAYLRKSTLIDLPLRYAPYNQMKERLAGWFLR